jgi:hypothetical protein
LRVMSRFAEAMSAPAYQAFTTVRRSPNARIATTSPTIVSRLLRRWRKMFLKMSLR